MSDPDKRHHARQMVRNLSSAERDALRGMLTGEGVKGLADRLSLRVIDATHIRDRLKWKLGVLTDAEAVRVGLLSDTDQKMIAD